MQSTPPERELIDKFIDEVAKGYRQQAVRDGGTEEDAATRIADMTAEINDAYEAILVVTESEDDTETERLLRQSQQKRNRDALLEKMGEILARATFLEANLLDTRKMKAAELDAAKSTLDLAVRDDLPTAGPQQTVDVVAKQFDTLTLHYQQAADHREALKGIIDDISAEERRIDKQIADNRAEMEQIAKSIGSRQSNWIEGYWLGKKLLESPILDAFNSPLQIENLWTDGLTHNYYNFKPVLRYDRCTTCHQAMEQTQAGSAVDPKFESAHELTFALQSPTREELAELLGAAPPDEENEDGEDPNSEGAAEVDPTASDVYGFMLADQGVLNRDDVTISYVRNQSPAAKARLAEDEVSVQYLSTELIEASASAAFEVEGKRWPQFGFQAGDVIVSIGGDAILSANDIRRMVLDTIV